MRYFRLVGFWLVALALIAGCSSPTGTGTQAGGTPGPVQSGTAGAEQLQFTATTLDGTQFSGQSLAGKPAVLWFWAPWCPICRREAPTVAKAAQASPGVTFVGVASLDQLPAMKDFVAQYHLGSFTHLADSDGAVWQRFGVTAQPAYAFIGTDATVDVVRGTLSEQQLTERLSRLGRT